MPIYKDDSVVYRFHVGLYATTNKIWWTQGKELKTIIPENVFQKEGIFIIKKFNKFEDIKLFIRPPLKSEKSLFYNDKSEKIGVAKNEITLKRLILNYRYSYDEKIKNQMET